MTRQRGFTLVEILVVVAIIALLVAIIIPVFFMAERKAREGTCQMQLHEIATALAQYRTDNLAYPEYQGAMQTLVSAKVLRDVKTCPLDPNKDQKHDSYGELYNYWGYQDGSPTPVVLQDVTQAEGVYDKLTANESGKRYWKKDKDGGYPDADFPGLANQDAPPGTIITICPHHVDRNRYVILRVGGNVTFGTLPSEDPLVVDGNFWTLSGQLPEVNK